MRFWIALLLVLLAGPVVPQADLLQELEEAEDNGFFISLLEDRLSTEDRKIRLSGVEGLLSSAATVARITISDTEGVWLQIENATIDWNRAALLRGRVDVNALTAERIAVPRRPVPGPASLPDPGARSGFSIPDLPVSVQFDRLAVGVLDLGEPVVGIEAELSLEGALSLGDRSVEAALQIDRLDGPGGQFALSADVDEGADRVDVALNVSEPPNGVFANLLGLDGRPALETAITATGSYADLTAEVDFRADGADLLDGTVTVRQENGDRSYGLDLAGRFRPLTPPEFHDLLDEESTLTATARQRDGGGFTLQSLALESGGLTLQGSLRTAPDGFPEAVDLSGALTPVSGDRIALPFSGGATVAGATLSVDYGRGPRWTASIRATGLESGATRVASAALRMGGIAQDLRDPAARRLTAQIDGLVDGVSGEDPALAETLDGSLGLRFDLDWAAGAPVTIREGRVEVGAFAADLTGTVGRDGFDGRASVAAPNLARFATLTGRPLAGGLEAEVAGRINPLTGAFDVTLDGMAADLRLGVDGLDPLLGGETVLSGGLRRDTEGVAADRFSLSNDQVSIAADGAYASEGSDLALSVALSDLDLVTDRASGAVSATAMITGGIDALTLGAEVVVPSGTLDGQPLENARLAISAEGSSLEDLAGMLDAGGRVGPTPVQLTGAFALDGPVQALRGARLTAGASSLTGTLARGADGLIAGTVEVDSPDFAEVARLVGQPLRGAGALTVILSRSQGTQAVALDGAVDGVVLADMRLDRADLDLRLVDVLGLPRADGALVAEAMVLGGVALEGVDITALADETATEVAAEAAFGNGTAGRLSARVTALPGGAEVDLAALSIARGAVSAILEAPSRVRVEPGAVTLSDLALRIGEGRLTVSGSLAERLALALDMADLPLSLADLAVPDLGLRGGASGQVRLSGTAAAPEAVFDLALRAVGTGATRRLALPNAELDLRGRTVGRLLRLDGAASAGPEVAIEVAGVLPLEPGAAGLDLGLALSRLDLGILAGAAPALAPEGVVEGTVRVTGRLDAPSAAFDLSAQGVTAAPGRARGLPALALALDGAANSQAAQIRGRASAGQDLSAALEGTVPLDPAAAGLDLSFELERLALGLADAVLPDLGLDGQARGSVRLTGTLAAPVPRADLVADGVTATAAAALGLPPAALSLAVEEGEGGRASVSGRLTAGEALRADLGGSIGFAAAVPDPALRLDLAALDLSALPGLLPDQGLRGIVAGAVDLTGPATDPRAAVGLTATALSTAGARAAELPGVEAVLAARYGDDAVDLDVSAEAGTLLSLAVQGRAGVGVEGALDLTATVERLALRFADAVAPALGLRGTVEGRAEIGGVLTSPEVVAALSADGLGTLQGVAAGLPGIEATVEASYRDRQIDGRARLTAPAVLDATLRGQVPVDPDAAGLALKADIRRLALSLADAVVPDLGLRGEIAGSVDLAGSLAAPEPSFALTATDVTAAAGRARDLPPARISAEGRMLAAGADPVLDIAARAEAGGLVDAAVTGRLPLDPGREGVDLAVALDRVDLEIADTVLPELGLRGVVTGAGRVTGALDRPIPDMRLSARGISTALGRAAGLPPVEAEVSAAGSALGIDLDGRATAAEMLALTVQGFLPMSRPGDGLDLSVDLGALDLALSGAVLPDLGAAGTLRGQGTITGSLAASAPRFTVEGEGLTTARMQRLGLPGARLRLSGSEAAGLVDLDGLLEADAALSLTLSGTVPTDPARPGLDLTASLQRASLSLANALAPGQRFSGSLAGRVQATGSLADPVAAFNLTAAEVSADVMRQSGLSGARITADGRYAGGVLTLDEGRVTAPPGALLVATGTVPFDGGAMALSVDGQIPLRLANVALARSNTQLGGSADLALTVGGPLREPNLAGTARISDGRVLVRNANLQLEGIGGRIRFDGRTAVVEEASAALPGGGNAALRGSVRLSPTEDWPADLELVLRDARYTDGNIVDTVLDGRVTLVGPALGAGTLGGEITLKETEISIPSRFGINEGVLLDIRHQRPPEDVVLTLDRADLTGADRREPGAGVPLRLDLTVRAPNRLFIRGRGLDAEMGGEIRLRGGLNDLQPVGQIALIRGRLGILGQRFDFDEGNVTLLGSPVPRIRLVAVTDATDGTVINVIVEGEATDPVVTFESAPPLPQDEVLALLIFNRNLAELSPVQVAQLAAAAATLAGSGGGVTGGLRNTVGLSDLDITTDDDGDVGVRAGAYLDENIYLDVETDTSGDSRATINLDLTDSLRARASVDNRGDTTLGIFFERDY